ncbi:hypothetical protein Ga0080559_TMP1131 [Salipiger profundus]|uniref:Uncharacterized protein n=1 Tax=Salipiger profundus TaxID=1229727 RepID=A0A1U7D191_9RHOB|nr:hypothetical protein Ga0080559_TMP1131 [Salipiger profundus]
MTAWQGNDALVARAGHERINNFDISAPQNVSVANVITVFSV